MIIGTLESVAESLFVSKARAVKLVLAATPEGLLQDFAAARVDWIVWPAEPRMEVAVECEVICAARPVAASCVACGDATLRVTAAGWCARSAVGTSGEMPLPAARGKWLGAWVRLLMGGPAGGRDADGLVLPLLTLAVGGASALELRESTDLAERTFRYRLARCGCRGSRRLVMVSQTLLAWEAQRAGGSCERAAFRAGYETLSAFDRMLNHLVGVTAGGLAAVPEMELARRLEAALWREDRIAESG